MNTDIRNASTNDLRTLAHLNSPVGVCARRILAEREAASERLSAICRSVASERAARTSTT
jgi:hypothetical protein